jgi:hypothetical protein
VTYAVLFKIYFLDLFVIRQLERLKARVGQGHLYVVVDETNGPVGPIPHDRVLRTTENDMILRSFVKGDPSAMFWYSADYSLFPLIKDYRPYDYYVTIEYDAVVNIALGKPATQSSVGPASRNPSVRNDAAGAVNGLLTGTYGFHTGHDDPPWWMVDLEEPYRLSSVWIFNRLDAPSTLQHLSGNMGVI